MGLSPSAAHRPHTRSQCEPAPARTGTHFPTLHAYYSCLGVIMRNATESVRDAFTLNGERASRQAGERKKVPFKANRARVWSPSLHVIASEKPKLRRPSSEMLFGKFFVLRSRDLFCPAPAVGGECNNASNKPVLIHISTYLLSK